MKKILETTYPKELLRKHCQEIFKVSTFVFDGALSSINKPLSKTEAQEKINAWLNKEVK